jgi:hypothetical protein
MKTTSKGLGRRGIALPVALVGLVAVSLLVTTALLTSSAEFAISAAQTTGSRALYTAEGGMQEFVRTLATNPALLVAGSTRTVNVQVGTTANQTAPVRITANLMATIPPALPANPTRLIYAVTAEPLDAAGNVRGRSVVAFIEQTQPPPPALTTNITSAITLGGDLDVNGNAFTVNGRYNGCGTSGGVDAVRAASGSAITANNQNHMNNFLGYENGGNTSGHNAIDRTTLTRDQLARDVLGGMTLQQLINVVPLHRKWGPRFNRPTWSGYVADSAGLAVVDANDGTVDVLGGGGVLIVVNGNMRMRGNSRFDGIIIVEGNFDLAGTPTVNGALISLAQNDGQNLINLDNSALASGHITVQFNKCEILEAQQKFGNQTASVTPTLLRSAFAWSEVVR